MMSLSSVAELKVLFEEGRMEEFSHACVEFLQSGQKVANKDQPFVADAIRNVLLKRSDLPPTSVAEVLTAAGLFQERRGLFQNAYFAFRSALDADPASAKASFIKEAIDRLRDSAFPAYANVAEMIADYRFLTRSLVMSYLEDKERTGAESLPDLDVAMFALSAIRPDHGSFEIRARFENILLRETASIAAGHAFAPSLLKYRLKLTHLHGLLVMILFFFNMEDEFRKIVGHLPRSGRRGLPPIWFLTELVRRVLGPERDLLSEFGPDSPLVRHGIVYAVPPEDRPLAPLIHRCVELDDGVINFLMGRNQASVLVGSFVKLHRFDTEDSGPSPSPELQERLLRQIDPTTRRAHQGMKFLVVGKRGVGKLDVVRRVGKQLGLNVMHFNLAFLKGTDILEKAPILLRVIAREALLNDAILCVELGREWDDDPQLDNMLRAAGEVINAHDGLVFLLAEFDLFTRFLHYVPDASRFILEEATGDNQLVLWDHYFKKNGLKLAVHNPEVYMQTLSTNKLNVPLLSRRLLTNALADGRTSLDITDADFRKVISDAIESEMGIIMQKITPSFGWEDLILPQETLVKVNSVISFARYKKQVMEEWGFAKKLPYGKALSVLLYGHPGTGKTMLAHVIAQELGLELYRVDLAAMMSKYIGETEKNLKKIFDLVMDRPAILMFEEADSLFSKRTEVQSSIDRYSNVEVNYLLQKMEEFEGITVLTTNYVANIDDAFKRRIRFKISFALPDFDERKQLWRIMIPKETPVDERIDFAKLAKRFEFAPSYIKTSIVRAAFDAAESNRGLTTRILFDAAVKEAQELGLVVKATMADTPKRRDETTAKTPS